MVKSFPVLQETKDFEIAHRQYKNTNFISKFCIYNLYLIAKKNILSFSIRDSAEIIYYKNKQHMLCSLCKRS